MAAEIKIKQSKKRNKINATSRRKYELFYVCITMLEKSVVHSPSDYEFYLIKPCVSKLKAEFRNYSHTITKVNPIRHILLISVIYFL